MFPWEIRSHQKENSRCRALKAASRIQRGERHKSVDELLPGEETKAFEGLVMDQEDWKPQFAGISFEKRETRKTKASKNPTQINEEKTEALGEEPAEEMQDVLEEAVDDADKVLPVVSELFKCQYCDSVFETRKNRYKHEYNMHIGERRFLCSGCGLSFVFPYLLRRHQLSAHHETSTVLKPEFGAVPRYVLTDENGLPVEQDPDAPPKKKKRTTPISAIVNKSENAATIPKSDSIDNTGNPFDDNEIFSEESSPNIKPFMRRIWKTRTRNIRRTEQAMAADLEESDEEFIQDDESERVSYMSNPWRRQRGARGRRVGYWRQQRPCTSSPPAGPPLPTGRLAETLKSASQASCSAKLKVRSQRSGNESNVEADLKALTSTLTQFASSGALSNSSISFTFTVSPANPSTTTDVPARDSSASSTSALSNEKNQFQCHFCPIRFPSRYALYKHELVRHSCAEGDSEHARKRHREETIWSSKGPDQFQSASGPFAMDPDQKVVTPIKFLHGAARRGRGHFFGGSISNSSNRSNA